MQSFGAIKPAWIVLRRCLPSLICWLWNSAPLSDPAGQSAQASDGGGVTMNRWLPRGVTIRPR